MAWDKTKPPASTALVSADIRNNWASLEAAIGNPDTSPLAISAAPTFKAGTSAGFIATASGRINTNTSSVSSVGAGPTDLISYSLPANTLAVNGQAVRVIGWGTFAATANATQLKGAFGAATAVLTSDSAVHNNNQWYGEFIIVRTGAATQITTSHLILGVAAATGTVFTRTNSTTETLSGAVTIKFTANGVANGDVVQLGMIVEVIG